MEDDRHRPFKAVEIGMTAVEDGFDRFANDGIDQRPDISYWRVNLTALSQKYNLYFIAVANEIHVYKPKFPFQRLGGEPSLVLTPRLANPTARGYIDPDHPNCINHLIVGDIGNREIILFSTDSGNVTAYETISILNAVANGSTAETRCGDANPYIDIRPFFTQWVEDSAWGLSIHAEARMIAVSANKPIPGISSPRDVWQQGACITVFAFALDHYTEQTDEIDRTGDESDLQGEWPIWSPAQSELSTIHGKRDRNYRIILAGPNGHQANIPCVTFLPSSQDRRGAWILSTDINEEIKLWRIWDCTCVKTWTFRDKSSSTAAWMGGRELGWIVAALDLRAFRPASDMSTFLGYKRVPQYYGYNARGANFDITSVVQHYVPSNALHLPDNSLAEDHEYHDPTDDGTPEIFGEMSDSDIVPNEKCADSGPETVSGSFASISPFVDSSGNRLRSRVEESCLYDDPYEDDSDLSDDETSVSNKGYDSPGEQHEAEGAQVRDVGQKGSNFAIRQLMGNELRGHVDDDEAKTSEISMSIQHKGPMISNHRSEHEGEFWPRRPKAKDHESIPTVPFIYTSTSHLRLFSSTESEKPHLFCARMLRQIVSAELDDPWIAYMDRLDMIQQIPELGIVLVASQSGRCAVCSLTKRDQDSVLGLRVDWVLPTKQQERAGFRPHVPLLGIAVSPIQGRSGSGRQGEVNIDVNSWVGERNINGVPTSFDEIMLDMSENNVRGSPAVMEQNPLSKGANSEDRRRSDSNQYQTSDGTSTKPYHWSQSKTSESWSSAEDSRRYRFMMTYTDMTVLTYELSRGIERGDIQAD